MNVPYQLAAETFVFERVDNKDDLQKFFEHWADLEVRLSDAVNRAFEQDVKDKLQPEPKKEKQHFVECVYTTSGICTCQR